MRRNEIQFNDAPGNDRPGDHWMCGRAGDQTPCSRGPCGDGTCLADDACKPRRTWAGKRRPYTFIAVMATVLFAAILSQTPWTSNYFKPGPLTGPHSQILSGTLTSDRCASCHSEATSEAWFNLGGKSHVGITSSDKCIECHHAMFDTKSAKWAHNVSPLTREDIRKASSRVQAVSIHGLMPSPGFDQNMVECSVCHKEHRGHDADLLAMSDSQCQTCHVDRFAGFASGHPDWTNWPYARGGEIAFDHSTHSNKHFPATIQDGQATQFACASCHTRGANGELARSSSFEQSCAACHDQPMRVQAAPGLQLANVPTIPSDLAAELGNWPENATGFFDGTIAPLTAILLAGDPAASTAMERIPGGDFSRIDEDDPKQVAAARFLSDRVRRLLQRISDEGQPGLRRQISEAGYGDTIADPIIQSISPQLVGSAFDQWFTPVDTPTEIAEEPNDASNAAASAETPFRLSAFPVDVGQQGFDEEFKAQLDSLRALDRQSEISAVAPTAEPNASVQAAISPPTVGPVEKTVPPKSSEEPSVPAVTTPQATQSPTLPTAGFGEEFDRRLNELRELEGNRAFTQNKLRPNPVKPSGTASSANTAAAEQAPATPSGTAAIHKRPLETPTGASSPLEIDPLGLESLGSEPAISQAPDTPTVTARPVQRNYDAAAMQPTGGWYRDDLRMAVSYRTTGHADPVVRAAIEMACRLPESDPARKRFLESGAAKSCVTCHRVVTGTMSWMTPPHVGDRANFTKFSHGPHLNIQALADCKHCHQISDRSESGVTLTGGNRSGGSSDSVVDRLLLAPEFLELQHGACASCHTPKAAGDNCTMCHRYHIHQK